MAAARAAMRWRVRVHCSGVARHSRHWHYRLSARDATRRDRHDPRHVVMAAAAPRLLCACALSEFAVRSNTRSMTCLSVITY